MAVEKKDEREPESSEKVILQSKSLPNRIYLKKQFSCYKMEEDKTIEENVDIFLKLIADLDSVKVTISDEDQAIQLLSGLPAAYEPLVHTLQYGSRKETLTVNEVVTSAYSKEAELKQKGLLNKSSESSEQVVNPWEVSAKDGGKIDYDKLIDKFGCQRLDGSLIDRVQRLTSCQPHVFLRRGVFFAHRDFNEILDAYERGDKFYLYTGRGPSSEALHLGHLIPFMFTKYLQEAFKVPLVIQLTDDEKFLWKNLSVEECQRLASENAKDIIACGFDISKTFIFSDFDYVGGALYKNMVKVGKCVTLNKATGIFGFSGEDNIGKISFPPMQAVPSFPSSFPHLFPGMDNLRCLIPCAIDQDPYFRMTRDVAPRLSYRKPALIESSFFPALQGENGKMSASNPNSAIYVTDSAEDIRNKINNHALSGGQKSTKDHQRLGADLEKDIPFKYLSFFLEDDSELEHIRKEYGKGNMLTGAVKERLAEVLTEMVERHRRARAAVTDEMVDAFMAVRPLPNMFQ